MITAFVGRIGTTELLIILAIILLLFGPKQLPKLSKMMGKTVNNFKKGMEEGMEDDEQSAKKSSEEEQTAETAKTE